MGQTATKGGNVTIVHNMTTTHMGASAPCSTLPARGHTPKEETVQKEKKNTPNKYTFE